MTTTSAPSGLLARLGGPTVARRCAFCATAEATHTITETGISLARCAGCGYTFVDPAPTEAGLAGFDGSAPSDALARALGLPSLLERCEVEARSAAQLFSLISSSRTGGYLLDPGASTGTLSFLARRGGFSVEAFEPSPARRELAAARGVVLSSEDIDAPRLPVGSFHVVALHHYLERALDPLIALARVRRLLSPHGLVFLTTRRGAPLDEALSPSDLAPFAALAEVTRCTAGNLASAFAAAQLRIVDLYSPDGHELVAIGEPA